MMSPDAEETFQKTLKNGYQGSEREMREAEEAMRQVIRELEQSGAEAQIRDLLSQFGNY